MAQLFEIETSSTRSALLGASSSIAAAAAAIVPPQPQPGSHVASFTATANMVIAGQIAKMQAIAVECDAKSASSVAAFETAEATSTHSLTT